MNDSHEIPSLLFGVALGLVLGYCAGEGFEKRGWRKEAVASGHAEWVVDDEGSPVWQWKEAVE